MDIKILIILNIIGIILVVYDKWASKYLPKKRIREQSFFLIAIFGGAVGVYLSMLAVRHKTKHLSFMIGLPVIIIIQVLLFFYFGN